MIDMVELGRRMMANAASIDDDTEFNHWARLGPMLINIGPKGINQLSIEEQQVVARAMNKLNVTRDQIA